MAEGAAAREKKGALKNSGSLGSLGFVLRANGQESRNCKQEGENQVCLIRKISLAGMWRMRRWEAGGRESWL